ncbi:hypothetical protein BKA70DRAFT_509313 [Coprinopsis sp. MPI-PUGE-AT-0042]|nr:hypothetical protein BKA70DRAFT_509313 [Coprinopsis sp. MPI-PUGE-AT-0042]
MDQEVAYKSVEEARKLLDDRLLEKEKEIIDIKHERNQLAPVSRLPVEVLARVFLDRARSPESTTQDTQYAFKTGQYQVLWMGVSHVCRQWREVALGCSELWSVLNPRISTKWIEAMIKRSKSMPISLVEFNPNYCFHAPEKREILLKVLSEPRRWRQIHVRLIHEDDEVVKNISSLNSPAPFLVDLSLNFEDITYGHSRPNGVLPRDFLGANAPSLRHLEIIHCRPSWNPNLFSSSLASLKLCIPPLYMAVPGDPFSVPSPQDLAENLARIPLLTELDLEMKLPDLTAINPCGRNFLFPNLQSLRLVGECEELAGLLSCLLIPPTSRVEVSCTKASEAALISLGWALDKAWTTKPVIDRVSLWRPRVGDTCIEGSNTSSPGKLPLLISMSRVMNWEWDTFPAPRSLFASIHWDHVETLSVECSFGQLGAEWRAIFENMKRVKNLKLFDESAQEFIKALTHLTKLAGSHPGLTNLAYTAPLPSLETLMIRRANVILTNKNLSRYGPNTQTMTVTFQDLVDWMQQRRVLGAPKLKEVAFKDCGGFSPKLKELFQKLQELGAVENLKRRVCRVELDDFDPRSESEEDEDDCDDGFCYASGDNDDDVCSACLEPGCEGECEIYI